MASASDFFQEVKKSRIQLEEANATLNELGVRVETLVGLVTGLATVTNYLADAAFHNAQQNDTIICVLEKIAHNTCQLVNEANVHTGLLNSIARDNATTAAILVRAHPDAAVAVERENALRHELETKLAACCPPEVPPPPCHDERCAAPKPLDKPPKVKPPKPVVD